MAISVLRGLRNRAWRPAIQLLRKRSAEVVQAWHKKLTFFCSCVSITLPATPGLGCFKSLGLDVEMISPHRDFSGFWARICRPFGPFPCWGGVQFGGRTVIRCWRLEVSKPSFPITCLIWYNAPSIQLLTSGVFSMIPVSDISIWISPAGARADLPALNDCEVMIHTVPRAKKISVDFIHEFLSRRFLAYNRSRHQGNGCGTV